MHHAEVFAHFRKLVRHRALEREDRLFFVADREQGTPHIVARAAREKFRNKNFDDLPLLVAGVLRFVDEHMIDAEIELVEYPGGCRASGGRIAEQRERFVDQVLVVEQAAAFFFRAIAVNHGCSDRDQRRAAVTRAQGEFTREQLAYAILFGVETRGPLRIGFGRFFGQHAGAAFAVAGAEHVEIIFDAFAPRSPKRVRQ